jgi:AcrR family transcriptional regulator
VVGEGNPDAPNLPPGLDLLWGRRDRGRRGPKPGLTIDAIVATAIELADREALAAVSMARLAKELGFTTMSLYRYISSKDEILQLMWNASALGAEDLVLEGDGWREKLLAWALVQREMLDRHPWITQMPMAAPPLAPNSMTFVERGLEALDGTRMEERDKLRVIGLISSYTLSEARMAHDAASAAAQTQAADTKENPQPPWTFEALLRQLLDEEHFPRLYRIAWSADNDGTQAPSEKQEFRFGLDRILDGIQALIEQSDQRD